MTMLIMVLRFNIFSFRFVFFLFSSSYQAAILYWSAVLCCSLAFCISFASIHLISCGFMVDCKVKKRVLLPLYFIILLSYHWSSSVFMFVADMVLSFIDFLMFQYDTHKYLQYSFIPIGFQLFANFILFDENSLCKISTFISILNIEA